MNRRQFIKLGSMWVPAATVAIAAPQIGLFEKIRKYFFAPQGGWLSTPSIITANASLTSEMLRKVLSELSLTRDMNTYTSYGYRMSHEVMQSLMHPVATPISWTRDIYEN